MTETVPAVVLAGGREPEQVARAFGLPHKALVPVGGVPVVRRVVEALQAARQVGPVAVATHLDEVAQVLPEETAVFRPTGDTFLETLQAGFRGFPQANRLLASTCDLPLLTPAAVDDFTLRSLDSGAELCYSIVRGDRLKRGSTGQHRLLIRLREGAYTGGNLVCLTRRFVEQEGARVTAAFAGRKNPVRLASLLGWGLVWGLLWGTLTLPQIIRKAERLLHTSVAVVDSEYPEVCMDIDKVAHVELAEQALGKTEER